MELENFLNMIMGYVVEFGKNILIALVILFIGKKLIKWVLKLISKGFAKGDVDAMVAKFVSSIVKFTLYAVLAIVIISILGIPTTSFIAAFSTAGVAIGLALQGSLSNVAGGVLILIFKPFRVGDYIVAQSVEGSVKGIDIFYTKLTTLDNKTVIVPNGSLANGTVTNVTAQTERRVDVQVGISYQADIREAKAVLTGIIDKDERILKEKGITVMVAGLDDSRVTLETRVWVKSGDYGAVKCSLLENYKYALDENGIEIPFNQLSVTLRK